MRIAIFAPRSAQPHPTGLGRYLRELVPALAREAGERDTIVLSGTREADRPGWVPRGVATRVVPGHRVVVHAAWCLGLGPRLERTTGPLDLVHLAQPFPPVKTTSPQVLTVHDLFPFEHPGWYPRSELVTFRRSVGVGLRRAARIVVPSAHVAGRLVEVLGVAPARVEVVAHGVSGAFDRGVSESVIADACSQWGLEPSAYVVCVGALSVRKNMSVLIRAMAGLPGDRIPLVLIGSDGHRADLVKAEIARVGGAATVLQTGYLPDEETAALVRGAAVLVHPALEEGFGFVPLEAMAVGTPVIAAGTSAIPEVVGDAAVLVSEPARPQAWASAIAGVFGSSERRTELAVAGRERAAAFSWRRSARMMLDIYAAASRT